MNKIKVFIVDDHSLVRDGISALLYKYDDIQIKGEASSGEMAIEKILDDRPDIVLMDINLTGISGIEVTKKLLIKIPDLKIIFLSMDVTAEFIEEGIKAGASGYLPKNCSRNVLLEAIRKVNAGEKYFDNSISEIVFEKFYKKSAPGESYKPSDKLSKREEEVLRLIACGYTNQDVSDKLFISIRTVDTHKNNIMKKLNVKSLAQVVKYALQNEIIDLKDII